MIPADEEVIQVVLEKYCHWLNLWVRRDSPEGHQHVYTPNQFTDYKPEQRLWGNTTVVARIDAYYPVFFIHASDGDEGGPCMLVAWLDFSEDEQPRVLHLTQEFDTYVQTIYERDWSHFGGFRDNFLHTPS
jgi:hypothetical protein